MDFIADKIGDVADAVSAPFAGAAVGGLLQDMCEDLLEPIEAARDKIADAGNIDAAMEKVQGLASFGDGSEWADGTPTSGQVEGLGEAAGGFHAGIDSALKDPEKLLPQPLGCLGACVAEQYKQSIVDNLGALKKDTAAVLGPLRGLPTKLKDDFAAVMAKINDEAIPGFRSELENLAKPPKEAADKIGEIFADGIQPDDLLALLEVVPPALDKLVEDVKDATGPTGPANKVLGALKAAVDAMVASVTAVADRVRKFFGSAGQRLADAFAPPAMAACCISGVAAAQKELGDLLDTVCGLLSTAFDAVAKALTDIAAKLEGVFAEARELVAAVATHIESVVVPARDNCKQCEERIRPKVEELKALQG